MLSEGVQVFQRILENKFILSKIRTNVLIWSICNEKLLNEIQILINRAIKAIYRLDWYTSSKDLLIISDSFSLKELISIERCKFIYKLQNDEIKHNIVLKKSKQI